MLKKVVPWMGLSGLALMTACGGGGSVNPPQPITSPTSQTTSVAFSVIVPQASSSSASARKRPNFTAPPNTQSVSITLKSVNGAAYSGTPSVFNLSPSTSGCTTGSNQLTCNFTMQVPAGNDDFLIQTFAQTGAQGTAESQASVTANVVSGQTTKVDTTLSGNIASVAISVNSAPLGAAVKVPVVVQAKDASGNTIIGTYSTPIVLADSESTHTTLSTKTLPDSTTAAGVTLNYDGGALTSATISATVSGLPSSAITNGTFTPGSSTYPTNNSTATFGVSSWSQTNSQTWPGPTSVPSPLPTSTYAATTVTQSGQKFGSLTGLVSVQTDSANFPTYYSWAPSGSAWSLGLVGYNDGNGTYLCSAPYQQSVVVPIPSSSWDALANSGSCSYTLGTETYVFKADGSYTDTTTNPDASGDGTVDTYTNAVNADGSASVSVNSQDQGSSIQTLSKSSANSQTVTVSTQTFPAAIPSPGATTTPAPKVTTAPNFYLAAGLTNGAPSPLESDKFTPKGTVTLPSSCAVPASIVGASATITEVDEAHSTVDPLQDWNPFVTSDAVQHFYLNGVGEICTLDVNNQVWLDNGGQQWFTTDNSYQTVQTTTESYLTTKTLQAAFVKTRSFESALPAAAMSLTMSNQQMAIHRAMQARSEHRKAASSKTRRLNVTSRKF